MAPNPIQLKTVTLSLAAVTATEFLAGAVISRFSIHSLLALALFRIIQSGLIVGIVVGLEKGLGVIGWNPRTWPEGIKKGTVWSMGFGLLAGLAMTAVYLSGHDPLRMLRSPLPATNMELIAFFLTGGIVAPVAEELFFRGILYSYFRRWGVITALATSTALFVALHSVHGLPFAQIVGGIVFAMAYEFSGNLMVPITIHALGNLAIFSLSLL